MNKWAKIFFLWSRNSFYRFWKNKYQIKWKWVGYVVEDNSIQMYCQNETQYLVIGSYSELMTFPLNKEVYTCRVSESSEYVTYFFHIALLAMSFTYILGCRQSIWTFQVNFIWIWEKIQICVAFFWEDDLIMVFLSAYIFVPNVMPRNSLGKVLPSS